MDKLKIGYLSCLKHGEQYIGGIMITDISSIPLEFKYTEPIKPTKIHKIIFGKVMEKYITDEVIKKNLLREIKHQPSVIFVSDISLLKDDNVAKIPVVALQETSLPSFNSIGEFQRMDNNPRDILVQPSTSKHPLKLSFYTPEVDVQDKVVNLLKSVIDKVDLYEPFNRVETALQALCQPKD